MTSRNYTVTWTIDIEADTPRDAALEALAAMRDSESTATVFQVEAENGATVTVDLLD